MGRSGQATTIKIEAKPGFCNNDIGAETCVIIDTEIKNRTSGLEGLGSNNSREKMKDLDNRGQSYRGNLIIDYVSLKKHRTKPVL